MNWIHDDLKRYRLQYERWKQFCIPKNVKTAPFSEETSTQKFLLQFEDLRAAFITLNSLCCLVLHLSICHYFDVNNLIDQSSRFGQILGIYDPDDLIGNILNRISNAILDFSLSPGSSTTTGLREPEERNSPKNSPNMGSVRGLYRRN